VNPPPIDRIRAWLGSDASNAARIVRSVLGILIGDAAAEAVNTVVLGRQALTLGPAGFGALSAAQAFVDPFRAVAAFGLTLVAVTVASRRSGPDGSLVRTLFSLYAALSVAASVVAVTVSSIAGRGGPTVLVASAAAAVFPVVALGAARLPAQYEQALHRLIALPLLIALVRLGLVELAIRTHNTALAHQWALNGAALFGLIATWLVVKRLYPMDGAASRAIAKDLLRLAWPIAVLDVTVTIYLKAAYILLEPYGQAAQGAYAAAERLAQPITGISAAIVASALPTVTRAAQSGDASELSRVYRQSILRATVVLVPALSVAAAVAPAVFARFAPQYIPATRPFQVLLIGGLFMFLNQLSSMFIVGIGRVTALMMIAFANLAVYLALAIRLVPIYGATGSAIATAVMEGINCAMQLVLVRSLIRSRTLAPR
jgi:O-antigen/teichoic acid export membrane protein